MKIKHSLWIIAVFCCLSSSAQYYYFDIIPPFGETNSDYCPSDPDFDNYYPQVYWEAYQTEDDTWFGEHLDQCISSEEEGWSFAYHLNEVQPNKTLFLKAKMEDWSIISAVNNFQHNRIFRLFMNNLSFDYNMQLNLSDTCADGLCSGIRLHLAIPDSTLNDTIYRPTQLAFDTSYIETVNADFLSVTTDECFMTEKFPNAHQIKEFIIKITMDGDMNTLMQLPWFEIWGPLPTENIYTIENATPLDTSDAFITFVGNPYTYTPNNMLMHGSGYPSESNIYYHEVQAIPNTYVQDTIYIYLPQGEFLTFQPHTEVIGGWNEDSTARHNIIWLNDGTDMCFGYPFIEVRIENGNQYIHRAGNFELTHNSCMMFGNGGKLKVDDNASMIYGSDGYGIMMFKTGAQIEIGQNSSLTIGNRVILRQYEDEAEPRSIRMELNEGSHLEFTSTASINNTHTVGSSMQLEILMKGGTIDLDQLDLESRSKIKLIYPGNEEISPIENIENVFLQNNQLFFGADAFENTAASIQIFNLNGQRLWSETFSFQAGYVEYKFNIPPSIANGIYLYSINNQTGNTIQSGSLLSGL